MFLSKKTQHSHNHYNPLYHQQQASDQPCALLLSWRLARVCLSHHRCVGQLHQQLTLLVTAKSSWSPSNPHACHSRASMRGMISSQHALALVVLGLVILSSPAQAGGYGKGKPHRLHLYPESEWSFNHAAVAVTPANSLPSEFNWGGHEGVNYLTASWNQHIPQ